MTAARRRRAIPRLMRRYLAAGLVIAALSGVGAVWLAATTQTSYNQARADASQQADADIQRRLLVWATSHDSWQGIRAALGDIVGKEDRRLALLDPADGTVIADTDPKLPIPEGYAFPLLPEPASSTTLEPDVSDGTDGGFGLPLPPGPFLLSDGDRDDLARRADAVVDCLGKSADRALWESGRTVVGAPEGAPDCGRSDLNQPLPSEVRALADLGTRVAACLTSARADPVLGVALDTGADPSATSVEPDVAITSAPRNLGIRMITADDHALTPDESTCADESRIRQLYEGSAPNVDVVFTDLRGDQRGIFDLSPGSNARILLVVVGILLLVLGASTIIVLPTLRGMRALTVAVDRFAAGDRDQRVQVRADDEVAHLGAAFNQMAERVADHEESRRRLLGDVAHELRNPLTNMRGWLEASEDGIEISDAELHRILMQETLRLQRITADLQVLAQAEAGALSIERGPVELAELVQEVVEAQRPAAAAKGVAVHAATGAGITITSDRDRLRQAVDNLVANAIRHTPEAGHVTVSIGADGALVRITVADTGAGIAPDDLERIFDRFWRGDPARARAGESTGLGLSIVRAFVEALAGTVAARSTLGAGADFTITLPR